MPPNWRDEPGTWQIWPKGILHTKIPQLVGALEGYLSEHHRFLLSIHMEHIGYLEQAIARQHQRIEDKMRPYQHEVELIKSDPGFDTVAGRHTFVEIGGDINLFPSERHLASWAGICPGNNESAGKRKSGRVNKGNRWLKGVLVQAPHAASRTKGTHLKSFYHRVTAPRGKRRATVALAHR
jgi:transposase